MYDFWYVLIYIHKGILIAIHILYKTYMYTHVNDITKQFAKENEEASTFGKMQKTAYYI